MHKLLNFLLLCFIALCAGVYFTNPHAEISIGAFALHGAEEEDVEQKRSKIRLVGDVMLARNVEYLMDTYGSGYPFSTLPVHDPSAYLVGNFESAIPHNHVPTQSMTFTFSVDPMHIAGAQDYGFTHFGLSNNHAYDFKIEGFSNTRTVLEEAGFSVFGDPYDLSSTSVTVLPLASSSVAVIGIYAVYDQPQLAKIIDVFEYAQSSSTYQVAYVHWGEEYSSVHNHAQQKLAHQLIDAGADAVIGHHPHVIQDIALYKNAPIVYSLGNFIFDQYFSEEVQLGLIADLAFSESELELRLIPVTSIGSRSVPRLALTRERDAVLADIAKNSDTELQEMIASGVIKLEI